MKVSKSQISKKTRIISPANNLSGKIGFYRVEIDGNLFQTDHVGHLFYSKSGESNPAAWISTDDICENKMQFVFHVFEWIKLIDCLES